MARMNPALLIDAIVRQTTVLIAALATSAGQRATLSRVADQVFADLVRELSDQGVGHKVIADMFGMALRTYHKHVARLAASTTEHGKSLWEAVLTYVEERGPVSRAEVLGRFARDSDATVRGVLRDLVESGLVYQSGRAETTSYRAADAKETLARRRDPETLDRLVQVAIYRNGPVDRTRLAEIVPVDDALLDASLSRLVAESAVCRTTTESGVTYDCATCVIEAGDAAGWEAAVFDHYQAMVSALVAKLRSGKRRADFADQVGGSTFVFDLWRGHPLLDDALGYLRRVREQGSLLRKRIAEHNESNAAQAGAAAVRVVAYVGQTVQEESTDDSD
jgi:hypothetical protein